MGIRNKIAVLMACHNRRDITIRCLTSLEKSMEAACCTAAKIFLVDDGSTDGTSEAVRQKFPTVEILHGDGNLYWAKGMRKAWDAAVAQHDDWDGFFWLNDDTELNADALGKMLEACDDDKIVVGDLVNSRGEIVYGLREAGLFTGNCVLVPHKVYEQLGMICGEYSHAWADSDYAMVAKRAGIAVVCAGVVGKVEGHPNRPSLQGLTLRERIGMLRNPKGWNLHDLWLYRRRNWGLCVAIASCAHLFFRVIVGESNSDAGV